ncbi:NAD(P)/FAD-dependent oxidoreductase [Poseidonocella pacifica]|nr:FAD-dependent oxidoreductase [Poseidonocella pacifica]
MVDLTVRGAGIFGLSIAWACLRRGASVRIIDPGGPGAGASGGIVGALAPHVPENWNEKKAFQFESLMMAEEFWGGVDAASGLSSGYARLGRLQPIADEAALAMAQARAASAASLWKGQAIWRVISAEQVGAWAPQSPTGLLIEDSLSGRLHPRKACASLAAALTARGVEIRPMAEDEGRIVHATGWQGLLELNDASRRPMGNGVKGQAALFDYDAGDCPQLFADALHIVPHADGTVAVGSTSERDFASPDSTDGALDDVIFRAQQAFPVLRDAPILERWAGVRPRSRSRAPMLGQHPQRAGEFIANGGFKIGFGMAPKVAQVMADLILEGRDAIPEGFRPEASL